MCTLVMHISHTHTHNLHGNFNFYDNFMVDCSAFSAAFIRTLISYKSFSIFAFYEFIQYFIIKIFIIYFSKFIQFRCTIPQNLIAWFGRWRAIKLYDLALWCGDFLSLILPQIELYVYCTTAYDTRHIKSLYSCTHEIYIKLS